MSLSCCLRQSEEDGDRPHFGNDDDAGIRRAHQVALVNQTDTGATVDRCNDRGIVKKRLRVGDGRVVSLELRAELAHQRALGIDRFWCDG